MIAVAFYGAVPLAIICMQQGLVVAIRTWYKMEWNGNFGMQDRDQILIFKITLF